MHHVAIMKKSWGLTDKILSGEKIIESRWYSMRVRPWNAISIGDTVYFKDSGHPMKLKATVKNVLQFEDLNPNKVSGILKKYGSDDGISKEDISKYFELFKNKKYCILIFLQDVEPVQPFQINKKGFGMQSAWVTVKNIEDIRILD